MFEGKIKRKSYCRYDDGGLNLRLMIFYYISCDMLKWVGCWLFLQR